MGKWIAALLVAATIGGVAIYQYRLTTAPPSAAPEVLPPAPPPVAATGEPKVRFPVPESPASATPLPPLEASDSALQDALAGLYGRETLARFFSLDDIVRRFVATIDNLPRKTVAARLMPVKPVGGVFHVSGSDASVAIAADNHLRYRPYVQAMEAVEAKRLVALYTHVYPLFQAAYQELGYPDRYFNDQLVDTIDDLLAAPDVAAPGLTQPKVLYQFADAGLEARSAGQKIMIRMGGANAARVKDKLRAIRRELTGAPAPA